MPKPCATSTQPLDNVQAANELPTALQSATPLPHPPATALVVREDTAKHHSATSTGTAEASASAPEHATQQATTTAAGEQAALLTPPKMIEAQPSSVEDMATKLNLQLKA